MEIKGTSAYTSASKIAQDDEKQKEQELAREKETAQISKDENDTAEFSRTDFDEADVEEKARNYLQNILIGNLTEESQALTEQYLAEFDVAKFIRMYGPFTSASEISAAMYAATAGLIKYQEEE